MPRSTRCWTRARRRREWTRRAAGRGGGGGGRGKVPGAPFWMGRSANVRTRGGGGVGDAETGSTPSVRRRAKKIFASQVSAHNSEVMRELGEAGGSDGTESRGSTNARGACARWRRTKTPRARVGGGGGERDEAKTRGDHAAATHRGQAQEDEKRGAAGRSFTTTRNIGARLISSPNHSKQREL